MIRTVSELLEAFRLKEVEILDNQNLKHAPTIGRMYEGLTQEILRKALPGTSNLRVVSGFIESNEGDLSRQIDCMLVSGEGTKVPYTDDFKYNLAQVIAVVEVKKNLYTDTLDSAYRNLISTKEISLKGLKDKETSKKQFRDAYYNLIGEDPFSYEDVTKISVWKYQIGLALNAESLIPIRVVIGYHGFASENSLRNAFIDLLNKKVSHQGYGPISLPNLITSGNYSLIKLNFMPFGIRVTDRQSLYNIFGLLNVDASDIPVSGDNMWPLYASYPVNPLLLLLELIWTRLEYNQELSVSEPDLGVEIIRPLMLAKAIQQNNQIGWHYEFFPFSDEQLTQLPTLLNWKPIEINEAQCILLLSLIEDANSDFEGGEVTAQISVEISQKVLPSLVLAQSFSTRCPRFFEQLRGEVHTPELLEYFDSDKERLDEIIQSITNMGVAVLKDGKLKLQTRHLKVAVLPNRKIVAGDDNEGMFTRWLSYQEFN